MTNMIEFPKAEAKKAVILARVSSREQEDGHSIDAQKHRLQTYCQRRNLDVLQIFEITESSTNGDRKKFMEMLKFCKTQRQPIAIVADKVDRVQRSFKEYPLLDALIQEGKIELHFNTENYIIHKGSVSQERLMWSFGVIMAQSYVDSLRDNVKRSIDHKIKQGQFPSRAPIGYLNIRSLHGKGDIIIDELRSNLVQKIFSEFAIGNYTLSHITEVAKEMGLRSNTKNNVPLNRSHLYAMLTNPFYYGIMVVKKKPYPHCYSPLIDKVLFDKCQDVFKRWKKKPTKYGNIEFTFRGLITCKSTGQTVSAYTKKRAYKNGRSGEWTYLRSWNNDRKPIFIREEKLLSQVQQALDSLRLPADIMKVAKEYLHSVDLSERDFLRRRFEELTKDAIRLQSRLNGLMDLLMDGAITRNEFDSKKVQLRERQLQIDHLLAGQRSGDDGFKDAMLCILDLSTNAGDLFKGSTVEEKRKILNLVFSNLTLEEENLCYSYNFPFSLFIENKKTDEWRPLLDRLRTCEIIRSKVIQFVRDCKTIRFLS